jgi:hypothetical protein
MVHHLLPWHCYCHRPDFDVDRRQFDMHRLHRSVAVAGNCRLSPNHLDSAHVVLGIELMLGIHVHHPKGILVANSAAK